MCFLIFSLTDQCDHQVRAYERSNWVYNYKLDLYGPVYNVVRDGGNREKLSIPFVDERGCCPDPSTTPDSYMDGFCATNFTFGHAADNFFWDRQVDYSAFIESSFGYGITLKILN